MGERLVMVNMGQLVVSRAREEVLAALGLGSCVALCAYDPAIRLAGMIHVVLPDSAIGRPSDGLAKFADRGVPRLVEEMARAGALKRRLRAAVLGGANVLGAADPAATLDIGARNIAAVADAVGKAGLAVAAADVGGGTSRTARLTVATGTVVVKTLREGERVLAELG